VAKGAALTRTRTPNPNPNPKPSPTPGQVAKEAAKEETARARQAQREERARLQEQQKADRLARGGGKRQRCGVCVGCRAGNCGKCSCCLDMPRFGGTGGRRQPCKYRACSQLAVQVSSDWY
jgi:hypothetical protein